MEAFCKKRCSEKFREFHRKLPVLKSLFKKVAGLQTCSANVVVFWLLLSIFIPTKQICVSSLFSYHPLKALKNLFHDFSLFSVFLQVAHAFSR